MAENFQNINSLRKLNRDFNPINQPDDTYVHASNFVQLSDRGDFLSLTNEKGTAVFCNNIPESYKVCGYSILDKDIILFLNNPVDNLSQIGIIDRSGSYEKKVPSATYSPNELTGLQELGTIIKIDNPIDAQARKLFSGNRIIYWTDNEHPIGYLNLDNPPKSKLLSNARLIPFRKEPIIDSVDLVDSSSILTAGVYQFAFKYITNEGNTLNVGLISNPIPVGGKENYESRPLPVNNANTTWYDGDNVNELTGKQIEVVVSNLDTAYTFVQILAVRFIGDNNDINVSVWRTLPIPSSGQITFNYDGTNIEEELGIEDVTELGISYTTAKCVEQKDNRLFFSNLKDDKEKYPINKIADKTIVKYKIEQVGINNDTNYQEVETATQRKGYMRNEVYSLALSVLYKDGSRSYAYHIPAGYGNGSFVGSSIPANVINKYTGVFVSTIQYIDASEVGTYPTGDGIRHHKMPSLNQEPHFSNSGGTEYINILSLEFDYTTALNDFINDYPDFLDDVEGFVFLRQQRVGIDANRSIFQQGIGIEVMNVDSAFNFSNNPEDASPQLVFKKLPMNGNFLFQTDFNGRRGGADYADFLAFTFGDNTNPFALSQIPYYKKIHSNTYRTVWCRDLLNNSVPLMSFYSPENSLQNRQIPTTGTKLSKELIIKCDANDVTSYSFLGVPAPNDFLPFVYGNTGAPNYEVNGLASTGAIWALFNYKYNEVSDTEERDINDSLFVTRDSGISDIFNLTGAFYDAGKSESHTVLKLNSFPTNNLHTYTNTGANTDMWLPNTGGLSYGMSSIPPANLSKKESKNYLYNITSTNQSQYGALKNADYVIAGYVKNPIENDTPKQIFGGDIFITKFGVVNKNSYAIKGWEKTGGADEYRTFPTNGVVLGTDYAAYNDIGFDLRGLMYFWVESTKNTTLRYDQDGISYFPKVNFQDELKHDPEFIPDCDYYNTQYSFENNLQIFLPKQLSTGQSVQDGYFTRTIYSEEDKFGTVGDTYRDFKVNSFNDLPKNTGEIWDTFVYNNTLYLHTTKSLWRTFINQVSQQATTVGQVYLGTGGLFNIPSQQLFTEKGGYGGTISQWGGAYTPYGYIFPDALQGKIFILNESLQEISLDSAMQRYFNDNLSVITDTDLVYLDNPYNNKGLVSGYDYTLKRWLLTKLDSPESFTISYSSLSQAFVSYHSYLPNVFISRDNDLFSIINSQSATGIKLHKHNVGAYGNFYGTIYPSTLELIVNRNSNAKQPLIDETKTFDNVILQMSVVNPSNGNKINPLRANGDTIQLYNDRCNSGITNLVYSNGYSNINSVRNEKLVRFKNDEYRISVPLNALDNNLPQHQTDGTIINNNLSTNNLFRERIKGKFANIKFSFSNNENLKLTLNYIKTMFRINYR